MTYEESSYEASFLSTCDAEGLAPAWAIKQIFEEHGSDFEDYQASTPNWENGEAILTWLGY
tara:strand:- start:153 stop:335 length:183 start_codon:yes stop_codon:yes gene_type:complete